MIQVLRALKYIHNLNIVHRDLKPENFLFQSPADDALLKMIDFGLGASYQKQMKNGKKAGKRMLMTTCGTVYFMAPEVIKEQQTDRVWRKADVWSVGCILLEMIYAVYMARPFWWALPRKIEDLPSYRKLWRFSWPIMVMQTTETGVAFTTNFFLNIISES